MKDLPGCLSFQNEQVDFAVGILMLKAIKIWQPVFSLTEIKKSFRSLKRNYAPKGWSLTVGIYFKMGLEKGKLKSSGVNVYSGLSIIAGYC